MLVNFLRFKFFPQTVYKRKFDSIQHAHAEKHTCVHTHMLRHRHTHNHSDDVTIDHNQDGGRLRNIKAGGYSYSDAKRSHDLPSNFDVSSGNKHKSIGLASLVRPNDNGLLPPINQISESHDTILSNSLSIESTTYTLIVSMCFHYILIIPVQLISII